MSYFKPNTKKAIKIAAAIKGLSATAATSAYVLANAEIALIILIVGGIANEFINLLSDNENPNTPI